jgi:arabinofuranosyltransferase
VVSRAREFVVRRWAADSPNQARVRRWIVSWGPTLLAGGAIWQFLGENRRVHVPVDDAYIFYRYAQNLAEGHGLVFNVGERVEGVTSLLWTLLVAAGVATGIDAVTFGHWLGVASGALLLVLTYRYAAFELVGGERFVAALAPWLLLLTKPFAVWATSGLETPLFAAAAVAVLIAEARGRAALALAAAAVGVLLRPEGVLLGAIVIAVFFIRRKAERKKALLLVAGYAAFLAALTLFRLWYFGAPLPNTFYAKVGGTMPWWGSYYVVVFVIQTLLPTLWPSFYAWRERYLLGGFCWIAAIFAFVAAVNGDSFNNSRFFLPMLPVSCVLVARGALLAHRRGNAAGQFAVWSVAVSAVWFTYGLLVGGAAALAAALHSVFGGPGKRRVVLAVLSVALVAGAVVLARRWRLPKVDHDMLSNYSLAARSVGVPTRRFEQRESRYLWYYWSEAARRTAEVLDARPPENKLVAALGIGSFGYHSRARVLDIVGLTDPVVARSRSSAEETMNFPGHQRSNSRYVLSKNPDYILIPERGQAFFQLPAVVELWDDPDFQRRYIYDPEIGGHRRLE